MHRLTARHFATFQSAVHRYMALYSVAGWHLEFHWSEEDQMAAVVISHEGHRVDVYLNCTWDDEPTKALLMTKARHEVFHIMVARFSYLANHRHATLAELTEVEEELVARLMAITKDLPTPAVRKKRKEKKNVQNVENTQGSQDSPPAPTGPVDPDREG